MATVNYKFTNDALDGYGRMVLSLAQLGIPESLPVQLISNTGVILFDGPYWTKSGTSLSLRWQSNSLRVDLSAFYPIPGEWTLRFQSGGSDSGIVYQPRETNQSLQAMANDLVICLTGGLVVTLPAGAIDKSAVKVAIQSVSSPVSVVPSSSDTISDVGAVNLSEAYDSAEFIYNASQHNWRLLTAPKGGTGDGGYRPVVIDSDAVLNSDDLALCVAGGITLTLPANLLGSSLVKVSLQNVSEPVTIVPAPGDVIDSNSEYALTRPYSSVELAFVPSGRIWMIATPDNSSGASGGYNPVETVVDYKAKADDLVICRNGDLRVTLPANQTSEVMVKVAAQEFGAVYVYPSGDDTIAGMESLLIRKNASAELAYGVTDKTWRIVTVTEPARAELSVQDDSTVYLAHETNIQNRTQFRDWIYRKLGYPLVSIELTQDHLDDAINDAIVEFVEYAYYEEKWYAFDLTQYRDGIYLPAEVIGVNQVSSNLVGPNAVGAGKIDNYMNDLIANGAVGFPLLGRQAGAGWLNFELAMSYLDFSQRMLGGDYLAQYNVRTRLLILNPDPVKVKQEKGWIAVTCYVLEPDDVQFGEVWVKKMALAQAKVTLGEVRNKFRGVNFPAGGTLSDDVKAEGLKELDELRVELRERFPVVGIFMK